MFSVIMPVYNGEKFIDAAINSVLCQSYTDYELIIINDGSTDNTLKVLEKYRDNPKICVFSKENQGVSVARNKAAELSQGDYLVFLDADDIWQSNHLSVMHKLIEKYPTAGFYGTFTVTRLVNGGEINKSEYFKNKGEDLLTNNFLEEYYLDKSAKCFTLITSCIPKKVFNELGGFTVGSKIGEDLELTIKAACYHPVALSSAGTAVYQKENSTATKSVSFDPKWSFFNDVTRLYEDKSITPERKNSLYKLMQWFNMRRCRHYLIEGDRKMAKRVFKDTDKRYISKKDSLINYILLATPKGLTKKIFEVRWSGKA